MVVVGLIHEEGSVDSEAVVPAVDDEVVALVDLALCVDFVGATTELEVGVSTTVMVLPPKTKVMVGSDILI